MDHEKWLTKEYLTMAWIVEHGRFYHQVFNPGYDLAAGLGPYSYAGNRWRDTATDLADPEGKYTGNVPDFYPVLPNMPRLEDKLYKKRTPAWGEIGFGN